MPKSNDIPIVPARPQPGRSKRIDRELTIRLLTPMFGGGVEAGAPDAEMPVRATSIRGQLQFWWRATVGASLSDYQELFQRQGDIWGRAEKASLIDVQVVERQLASPVPCASYRWNAQKRNWSLEWNPDLGPNASYALFPFQGKPPKQKEATAAPEQLPSTCVMSGVFRLRLTFPREMQSDIDASLLAWIRFGGIGARTRRGCGSLSSDDVPRFDPEHPFAGLPEVSNTESPREWPTLGPTILIGRRAAPRQTWMDALGAMQGFRQGKGFARGDGREGRPGRSRFPEPETIREATGKRSKEHTRWKEIPNDAFPRAELGLPIVFHFKDEREGDPFDTVLYPAPEYGGERMASPILTKAIDIGEGDSVAAILRLNATAPTAVELRAKESLRVVPAPVIRSPHLASYDNSPLKGSPQGSAIEAFLVYAEQKRGYRRATR